MAPGYVLLGVHPGPKRRFSMGFLGFLKGFFWGFLGIFMDFLSFLWVS